MTKLTKDNLSTYYDLTPAKAGEHITVLVGKKKSTNHDAEHPPFIVFKQGIGAIKDLNATLLLEKTGVRGILPVIAAGDDFFIREAFSDKPATKWSQVQGHAVQIMQDAINLSLAMLDTGLVDRDRKVLKVGDGISIKNLIISDNQLFFFDFDPERTINWGAELTTEDEEGIALWKSTHEKMITSLAINLGFPKEQTDTFMVSPAMINAPLKAILGHD